MLLRNDVLHMVTESSVLLVEQAVFATVACPAADELSRGGLHHYIATYYSRADAGAP